MLPFILAQGNPTALTALPENRLKIEHPALDGPIVINLSCPAFLDTEACAIFRDGSDRTESKMQNDLIEALADWPGVSLRDAESLADIWEYSAYGEYSHLDVGAIGHA